MSNILSLPLADLTIVTVSNEDWIESMKYVVMSEEDPENPPQLDLRGIWFEMEVRRRTDDHEVILSASRADGRLLIGAYPNYGYVLLKVPVDVMKITPAGQYVGDIVAHDGTFSRTVAQIALTIERGITR